MSNVFDAAVRALRQPSLMVRRIANSLSLLIVATAFVAGTSCARTSVTTGAMRTGSPRPATAVIYDDSERTIPAGRELDLRLLGAMSSNTAAVNQPFQGATVSDLRNGPRVIVPSGSMVHGVVRGVEKADDSGRAGRLTLSFVALVANGHSAVIDGTTARLFERGGLRDENHSDDGEPALTGGTIVALIDDLTSTTVSADGSIVAAQPGADAALAAGTIVRIRLRAAVEIR